MKSYLIVSVFLISIFSSFNTQAFSLKKGIKKLGKGLERTARGVRDTGKTAVNAVEYVGNKATGDDESAAKAKERMKLNGHDAVKNLGKGLERTFGGAMDTIASVVGTAFCPKETIGTGYCVEGGVECDYSSEGTQCTLTDSAGNRSEVPETQQLEIEWDQALAWVRENEMRDFFQQQNYDLIDGTLDMIFPDQDSKHRFYQLAQYTERILYDGTDHGTKIPEGAAQQQLVLSLSKFLQDIENQKGHLKFEPHSIDRSRNPSGVIAMTAIGLLTVYSIYMESTREVKGDEIHSTYIIEDILGIGSLIKAGITSISGLRATLGSAWKLGFKNVLNIKKNAGMLQKWKPSFTKIKIDDALDVNIDLARIGYSKPPYTSGTKVITFKPNEVTDFVRAHGPNNKGGRWVMRKADIEGLSPIQIKDKYALPEVPTHISDTKIPSGTGMRIGEVAPNYGSKGGGTQFEVLERVEFTNTRPIGDL